jgi:hypothetical protein
MSLVSIGTPLMTTEEPLALVDDGVERELSRRELQEKPITMRGGPHCQAMTDLATLLHGRLIR